MKSTQINALIGFATCIGVFLYGYFWYKPPKKNKSEDNNKSPE